MFLHHFKIVLDLFTSDKLSGPWKWIINPGYNTESIHWKNCNNGYSSFAVDSQLQPNFCHETRKGKEKEFVKIYINFVLQLSYKLHPYLNITSDSGARDSQPLAKK